MKNKLSYWEQRQVQNMYQYMQKAEVTADELAELYYRASRYLSFEAESIFEKFQTKHYLSKKQALKLINELKNKSSIDELLEKLKGSSKPEHSELVAQLESAAYQARIDRLRQLQNQLDYVMKNVFNQEKTFTTKFYTDLVQEMYYRAIFDIQQQTGYGGSFGYVNAKMIDRVIHSKWSGKNYSSRIWKNTRLLAKTLKKELLLNLVTGRSYRETADIIANKFGQGVSKARRLVRTESNYLSSEMNFEAYKEMGLEEYQFLATLDLRTSKICRSLDGKFFKVKDRKTGVNCNPMHPWCRSTTLSVINRKYLATMSRDALDPKTGKRIRVPRTMNYEEWYDKYVRGKPEVELEEKKMHNSYSDRKQYNAYKKVLGSEIPETLDDFQNMKYNNIEKWDYTKLDYRRQKSLMENPDRVLPNAENATVPDEKFTKYLFGGNNVDGLPKGRNFEHRLGYNIDNWQELQNEIIKGAKVYPSKFKDDNGYGQRYEQNMVLYGKNGTPANVTVGWLNKPDGSTTMTSAYIKEVK